MRNPIEMEEEEIFGIAAVSRLTGISAHVIRIWERRYQAVAPGRTDSQRRQYRREDIHRLTLLKSLTESGHSIGNLARLSTEALENRLQETESAKNQHPYRQSASAPLTACRIGFAGIMSRQAIRRAADTTTALQLIGEFDDIEALTSSLRPGAVDLLVIETPALFEPQLAEVQQALKKIGARRAIVVYRFAQSDAIAPSHKDIPGIATMQAPVDAEELRRACLADVRPGFPTNPAPASEPLPFPGPEIDGRGTSLPARRFSDRDLARISELSSVIKCECPKHLAGLLSCLTAFETYSSQCESIHAEDAKLHAFLHRAAAQCRATMEDTLQVLLEAEGIDLPPAGPGDSTGSSRRSHPVGSATRQG